MIIYTHTTPGDCPSWGDPEVAIYIQLDTYSQKKVKPKMITIYNRQKLSIATDGLLPKISSGE